MIQRKFNHATYSYIGDTVGDIKEAKSAKVTTVAVTWGWHDLDQLQQAQPDSLVHHPSELLSLFTK